MKPLVSVVVPVYNVEMFLQDCIKSILEQTYSNMEIILVDDGSTDKSGDLCDEIAVLDKRIQVIHKENGGLSDARNAGMEIAKGKYIAFFDSDDWMEKETIDFAVCQLEQLNEKIIVWGYYADFTDSNEKLIRRDIHTTVEGLCTPRHNNNLLIAGNNLGMIGYAWNKLYRLDFLQENCFRFKKGISLVEDILFNSQVMKEANGIVFSDRVFTHYMQRPRKTLGNKYYSDYFDLKMSACLARKTLIQHYQIDNEKAEQKMSSQYFGAVKSCIRMISRSDMMNMEKKETLRQTTKNPRFIYAMNKGKNQGLKDKVLCCLLKFHVYGLVIRLLK